jgi:hypothetical protein
VEPNPLWQPTPGEQADLRLKTSQADQIEIQSQVVTPEEVAATRYGGAEYNPGPIVIDIEGRQQQAQVEAEQQQKRALAAQQKPIVEEGSPETQGSTPLPKPVIDQPIYDQVPPMTAMPSDPITADPTTVPSAVEQTGAGGKPLKTQRPQTEG